MNNITKNMIKILYIIIGIIIGYWHLRTGMLAIFLFSEHEQILSWLLILSGPLITLPSIIISIKKMKMGALILLGGSIVSLFTMMISEGYRADHIQQFIIKITIPMLILAIIGYIIDEKFGEHNT
jgi:hypothetical protein